MDFSGLVSDIIAGFVAAVIFALFVKIYRCSKNKILMDLITIMGEAIEHRNNAYKIQPNEEEKWVSKAKLIENKAISKANDFSPAAGALVNWLDRIDPWNSNSQVERYKSILSKVIERIREILERNTVM